MSYREELLKAIQETEERIKNGKARQLKYRTELKGFASEHTTTALAAFLLPSFFAGWKAGKIALSGKKLRHFIKFIFVSALANVRKVF